MANLTSTLKDEDRRFGEEARRHYHYPSLELLLEDTTKVMDMVEHFKNFQLPRLIYLASYLKGENVEILSGERRKEKDMADIRAVHDFGGYITTFFKGFIAGNPFIIQYLLDNEIDTDSINEIEEVIGTFDNVNDIKEHNSSLVGDALAYGRAYEVEYRTTEDIVRVRKLSPENTFVIYDNSVEELPIAAVRFYHNEFEGEDGVDHIDLYTPDNIINYTVGDEGLIDNGTEPHGFGGVTIHELAGDEYRIGIFEKVIPLIDLYDSAQSDTANYMQDFNDAILAIFGDMDLGTGTPEDKIEVMTMMRKARLMHFVAPKGMQGVEGKIDAKYLTKSYDVAGTEAYKDRIKSDIHKFSFSPDLQDESFAGVQSGQAMKYKLFGLEVLEGDKENFIKKFLRNRYKLLLTLSNTASESGEFEESRIHITITPKLPRSLQESIENFNSLDGEMTNKTKLEITGVVEDPNSEQAKLDKLDQEIIKTTLLDKELTEDGELLENERE